MSPHPDDETLGTGGLILALRARGVTVTLVAVTDGERAYPDSQGLAELREREQTAALVRMGVSPRDIHRLRLPDSNVAACEELLVAKLLPLVLPGTYIIAPWEKDFHPDHEACGRAAQVVARAKKARLVSYFFWTWHLGTLDLLEGLDLHTFPLTPAALDAKRQALLCHQSQLRRANGSPILPADLLGPVSRDYEVFLPA